MIPIIIICYNNHEYVENTIQQIEKVNPEYVKEVIILNNASTRKETQKYVKETKHRVVNNKSNRGPWVSKYNNQHLYYELPDYFVLTDPDLGFNENLPSDFIEQMVELSQKFNCNKIGFAIDLTDHEKMFDTQNYFEGKSIYQWEEQFWKDKIPHPEYELYKAAIDTTFAVHNKNGHERYEIRMGGNFSCKHLPWYVNNPLFSLYDVYDLNVLQTTIFSSSKMILHDYLNRNYVTCKKNNQIFLIRKTDTYYNFWKYIYTTWNNNLFDIIRTLSIKDKIFIDIGSWIGPISMYASRFSKKVYAIEPHPEFYNESKKAAFDNAKNMECIQNAIWTEDSKKCFLVPNKHIMNSEHKYGYYSLHSSNNSNNLDSIECTSITLKTFIEKYNINPSDISLIKINISGSEEDILQDLLDFHKTNGVPLYISFFIPYWKNKNLTRFNHLTKKQIDTLTKNPFSNILFYNKKIE